MGQGPGRPRMASHAMLQEAAFELFQLRGYRKTSVEQIARTAGFSRATFFNFFSSKAELFWLETDALIDSLRAALESGLNSDSPPQLRQLLLTHASSITSAHIPWALQNYRLLEAADDLIASGASRVLGLNRAFQHYLGHRDNEARPAMVAAEAAAITGQMLTALLAWIDAGVERGSLRTHLAEAFAVGE